MCPFCRKEVEPEATYHPLSRLAPDPGTLARGRDTVAWVVVVSAGRR